MIEHKKTVLIVDDDCDIVDSTRRRLQSVGYEIITAFDGEHGLASAIDQHPDAIILDIRMPGMGGLAALDELKRTQATKDIPVVMLSASVVDRNVCLDSGARFFVKKPYVSKQLVTAIDTVMAEQDSKRE